MIRFPSHSRFALALLCATLVALRIAGSHLHLCFDGSEPPVSLHVSDAAGHASHDHESGHLAPHGMDSASETHHDDLDVLVVGDAIVKKGSALSDATLFALVAVLLVFAVARDRGGRIVSVHPTFLPSSRPRLRPPLRGPPRHA